MLIHKGRFLLNTKQNIGLLVSGVISLLNKLYFCYYMSFNCLVIYGEGHSLITPLIYIVIYMIQIS